MAEYDINVKQGATFELLLTIKDPSDNPIDLTGYTFRGQIRTSTSDPTIQATFTFALGVQSGGTLGQVTATLTAAATAAIEVPENDKPTRKITKMIYDIESEIGSEVTRWLEGAAYISPEVTK